MSDELSAAEARERTADNVLVLTTADLDDILREVVDRLRHTPDDIDIETANTWVASGIDTARHFQSALEAAGRNGRETDT